MKRFIIPALLGAVVLVVVGALAALKPSTAETHPNATPAFGKEEPAVGAELSGEVPRGDDSRAKQIARPQPTSQKVDMAFNDAVTPAETQASHAQNDPAFSSLLRKPIQQVAAAYEAQSRYPTFSQPINNSAELLRYKPHQPQTVSLPFPTPDGGTYQATLGLDRYRYLKGDKQELTLELSSSSGLQISGVQASVTSLDGDILFELPLSLGTDSTLKHRQTIDLSNAWNNWPIELQWKVTAQVGEQRLAVTAPFRYEAPVAVMEQPLEARVDGEFLVIPLRITTDHPGYFFVQANLYSRSGKPLAHLQAEGPVTASHPPIQLQVSGALLKHLKASGPYLMQDIQVERLGDDSLADRYGASRETAYQINGHPLTDYSESTWTDSLARQRLEFLQSLGAGQ